MEVRKVEPCAGSVATRLAYLIDQVGWPYRVEIGGSCWYLQVHRMFMRLLEQDVHTPYARRAFTLPHKLKSDQGACLGMHGNVPAGTLGIDAVGHTFRTLINQQVEILLGMFVICVSKVGRLFMREMRQCRWRTWSG